MNAPAAAPEADAATFRLLAERRFLPLFAVQFGGALNDNILRNALVAMIAFGSIAGEASASERAGLIQLAVALFMLPFLVFSPTAGRFADRCPDRAIAVRWLKGCEVATSLFAVAGLALASLPLLLTALFLAGLQSAMFGPFKYSLLPVILRRGELVGGNALQNASTFIAILLGVFWGTQLGVAENNRAATAAVMIAIAAGGLAAALAMLRLPVAGSEGWRAALDLNLPAAIARVVRGARRRRGILQLVLLASWFWGSGTLVLIQLPVLVKDALGYAHGTYLFLLLLVCCGVAAGSLLSARALKRKVSLRFVAAGIAAAALAMMMPVWPEALADPAAEPAGLAAFLSSAHALPVGAMLAAVSVAMGFYVVPIYASMQVWAPEGERGQTIAANNVFNALFIAGGATAAGLFVLRFDSPGEGIYWLFVMLGIAGLAVAAWCAACLGKLERSVAAAAQQQPAT